MLPHDAQDCRLLGILVSFRLQPEIIRARDAAADAPAAAVLEPGKMGGTPGDGQIKRGISQYERQPRLVWTVEPVAQHFHNAGTQKPGLKDAAVKENLRGTRTLARGVFLEERR